MHARTTRTTTLFAPALAFTLVLSLALAVGAAPDASAAGHGAAAARGPGNAGLSPDAVPHRGWGVTKTAPGTFTLAWRSRTPLPVTDARPEITLDGKPVIATSLAGDGRTVWATVTADKAPRVADLDVSLSGRPLDGGAPATADTNVPYVPPSGLKALADDPGLPGTHAIERSDYELDPVKLPDIPDKAEMIGHVVAPVDADANSPLVLFLHGRHEACYQPDENEGVAPAAAAPGVWKCRGSQQPVPSYLGYDYAQALLATQGYVTVSISANAINDEDWNAPDGGAAARAALIEDHLDAWDEFVSDDTYTANLDDVVLVGHSRGGEGANRASINAPVDAPYTITGQVLIGPTDFGFQASPYVPTVTLLPYCDGDVSDLQGQNFTDAARDIPEQPLGFHSSVLVMGANHNFFNTEWTPGISAAPSFDDWWSRPTKTCGKQTEMRLSAAEQRKVGKAYISGAVHLFADGDHGVLPMFDGSPVEVASAGNADTRSHAIGAGFELRRPGIDATLSAADGASTRLCVGQASGAPRVCDPETDSVRTPHWPASMFRGIALRRAFEMSWTQAGQSGGLSLNNTWDLTQDDSLDLRTIVAPGNGPAQLSVRIEDSSGRSIVVDPIVGDVLRPLPAGGYSLSKRWAQTLRVPLTDLGTVDPGEVTQIGLVADSPSGKVWVLDMSARQTDGIDDLPQRDVPRISIETLVQPEGDDTGTQTVLVPYTVAGGPLIQDATVTIVSVDEFAGTSGRPETLTIPAGTTSGTVPVEYEANTTDDPQRRNFFLAIYPDHGIMTDRYLGGATVIDDDPAPTIRVAPVVRRVDEGSRIQWKVMLSAPTSQFAFVSAKPVRGDRGRQQMTVGDLAPKFRKRMFSPVPPLDTPLWKTDLSLFQFVRPGHTERVLGLPTARHKGNDGPRQLVLRFRAGPFDVLSGPVSVTLIDR